MKLHGDVKSWHKPVDDVRLNRSVEVLEIQTLSQEDVGDIDVQHIPESLKNFAVREEISPFFDLKISSDALVDVLVTCECSKLLWTQTQIFS